MCSMSIPTTRVIVGLAVVTVTGWFSSVAGADFTLVVLPDTQGCATNANVQYVLAQTQWIRDNALSDHIAFVLHEGDIVANSTAQNQWNNANIAMSVLDGQVPYMLSVGNHDMGCAPTGPCAIDRNTAAYNAHFPFDRYESEPWYGGHMGVDNDNSYALFTAEGMGFLIVTLEFGPDSEMLSWANQVVSSYPGRRIIVLTHAYMNSDDSRLGTGDRGNPHHYGIQNLPLPPHDGEEMWESFVRMHPNIFLVLSGHVFDAATGMGIGRLTSIGVHGNPVHQLLANYQGVPVCGQSWLRVIRFSPAQDTISVTTYSPWLNTYDLSPQQTFDLSYDMGHGCLKADLDGDGLVNSTDLTLLLGAWAAGTVGGDIDGDGDTDSTDLTLLLGAWAAGGCP